MFYAICPHRVTVLSCHIIDVHNTLSNILDMAVYLYFRKTEIKSLFFLCKNLSLAIQAPIKT